MVGYRIQKSEVPDTLRIERHVGTHPAELATYRRPWAELGGGIGRSRRDPPGARPRVAEEPRMLLDLRSRRAATPSGPPTRCWARRFSAPRAGGSSRSPGRQRRSSHRGPRCRPDARRWASPRSGREERDWRDEKWRLTARIVDPDFVDVAPASDSAGRRVSGGATGRTAGVPPSASPEASHRAVGRATNSSRRGRRTPVKHHFSPCQSRSSSTRCSGSRRTNHEHKLPSPPTPTMPFPERGIISRFRWRIFSWSHRDLGREFPSFLDRCV